ncbi:hypothetical protein [Pelagicoccus mobilis]|uniref:Type II secretion system protein GspG C-terminal domain-containing protein n=1 Tax=Pelagicoccus mobilis TaxID=415221 RepID=A0A934VQ30_9BACT|nr:hypothetical protein [Pelagicoccus mobilis]MBK1877912.1 hypothetical protein [Pelagicoccus mobilis]
MPPKSKYTALALAASLLLGLGTYIGSKLSKSSNQPSLNPSATSPEEIEKILRIPKPQASAPRPDSLSQEQPTQINALAHLNQPDSTARKDIHILEHLLQEVHTVFHALPTGDHDEVVAFLRGENPLDLAYIPADDPNLNADGEIIDRWGTPYFFHTLSRHRIEVRSAGPDKLHWSEDDIISESQAGGQHSFAAAP